jgi:hypothetical protein
MKLIEGFCEYFFDLFPKDNLFLLTKLFFYNEENEPVDAPVYSAKWTGAADSNVSAILLDLLDEKVLIIKINTGDDLFKEIIFVSGDYDHKIVDSNDNKISLEVISSLLCSFEKTINYGYIWQPHKISLDEDFLNKISKLI